MSACAQIGTAFGYHSEATTYDPSGDNSHRYTNLMNFLGYFPLIGTISGLARLYLALCLLPTNQDKTETFRKTEICRASVEILSIGILFLIPDLIMTVGRACFNYNVLER